MSVYQSQSVTNRFTKPRDELHHLQLTKGNTMLSLSRDEVGAKIRVREGGREGRKEIGCREDLLEGK